MDSVQSQLDEAEDTPRPAKTLVKQHHHELNKLTALGSVATTDQATEGEETPLTNRDTRDPRRSPPPRTG
ncbi:hypothetical protein Bca101_067393 [Brassica carinata]